MNSIERSFLPAEEVKEIFFSCIWKAAKGKIPMNHSTFFPLHSFMPISYKMKWVSVKSCNIRILKEKKYYCISSDCEERQKNQISCIDTCVLIAAINETSSKNWTHDIELSAKKHSLVKTKKNSIEIEEKKSDENVKRAANRTNKYKELFCTNNINPDIFVLLCRSTF